MGDVVKGLRVQVYRNAAFGDCSNNGLSNRHDKLTLVGPGVAEIFEPDDDAPAVLYDPRGFRGRGEQPATFMPPRAVPVDLGESWAMFGGSFIYSSDSRFGDLSQDGHPIPLHDRIE